MSKTLDISKRATWKLWTNWSRSSQIHKWVCVMAGLGPPTHAKFAGKMRWDFEMPPQLSNTKSLPYAKIVKTSIFTLWRITFNHYSGCLPFTDESWYPLSNPSIINNAGFISIVLLGCYGESSIPSENPIPCLYFHDCSFIIFFSCWKYYHPLNTHY